MRKSKLLKGGLLAVFLLAAFLLPLTANSGESAAEGGGFYALHWEPCDPSNS